MYVSYSSSDAYTSHTGISMYSLFYHHQDVKELTVFLLDLGISKDKIYSLQNMAAAFHRDLCVIKLDEKAIRAVLGDHIPAHHGSLATYARLCAPTIYPKNVQRIIFIDSDMIIEGSLESVYNVDLGECVVAAVPARGDFSTKGNVHSEDSLIARSHQYYINCGFLMVDFVNWGKYHFSERVAEAASKLKFFTYKDQTILNAVLEDCFLYRLPCKYNYALHGCPKYLIRQWSHEHAQLSPEEIIEAAKQPIVIHYAGESIRPWYRKNASCLAKNYDRYRTLSPFKDEQKQSIFDTPKYSGIPGIQKVFLWLMYSMMHCPLGYPLYCINKKRIENQIAKNGRENV